MTVGGSHCPSNCLPFPQFTLSERSCDSSVRNANPERVEGKGTWHHPNPYQSRQRVANGRGWCVTELTGFRSYLLPWPFDSLW